MEDGVATACFATGMAAIGATLLSLLRGGDHIVASSFIFGNTNSLLATLADHGTPVTFVDATLAENVERAITPATRLVFVETIANPRTQVADLAADRRTLPRARPAVRRRQHDDVAVAVPAGERAARASIVNALTKYIGGHGNALGGAVDRHRSLRLDAICRTSPTATRRRSRRYGASRRLRKKGLRDCGATLAAEQAHHIAAGAETLALRMDRQCANAQALAEFLARPPEGERRPLPGACRRIRSTRCARALFRAPGALLSFELARGHDVLAILDRLRVIVLSSNLGDNRTLAIPVAQTIYWEMGAAAPRRDGHRRFARARVGRHRGSGGPHRRFRAGARLTGGRRLYARGAGLR